ncbi:MAG TPA: FAD-dependent oxidoreductase [Aestuariivirgaceae bacterium]|jgi:pyruvate/2-oxoglutarate dehydrogenase complex dihydrolipoamide dehydrogenase (E3) component
MESAQTPLNEIACDLCVIGAGPGGLTVASAAAQLGRKVVLIERAAMGGDCLNYGCVPSKALIAAARRAHDVRFAREFGIVAGEIRIDFAHVMERVREAIAAIAPDDSQERFENLGCTVIRAEARFVDGATVAAGNARIKARRFVIAAGSSPAVPPIDGLGQVPYFTSETIFESRVLPERLLVLGAGPMGLELAQAFRRLGSEVVVLDMAQPLAGRDPELAQLLLEVLEREGVRIVSSCKVRSIRSAGRDIALSVETGAGTQEMKASHLLLAAGRRPNVEGLDLERAGMAFSQEGIGVDARLRTTNPRVYAIGDIRGGLHFTHVAAHQARLVVRNALFRLPVRYDWTSMPWAIFTDPQFAGVGLTEAEAAARGLGPKILRWPLARSDRARIERRPHGLFKIVLDHRSRVIGAGIVAPEAGELILPWAELAAKRRSIRALSDAVLPYPTLSQESPRISLAAYAGLAGNPWLRRALDMLSSLG